MNPNSSTSYPVTLGLTGGIAAGKGAVAEQLRAQGVPVCNLDEVGREVMADPEVARAIAAATDPQVVEGGRLDRARLRQLLFAHPPMRERVEALIHPRVREAFGRWKRDRGREGHRLVICEAALLIEKGSHRKLDGLIVVLADTATRRKRLVDRDGIEPSLVDQILTAQTDDATRKKAATFVVNNDGPLEQLLPQVERLLAEFRQRGWWPPDGRSSARKNS